MHKAGKCQLLKQKMIKKLSEIKLLRCPKRFKNKTSGNSTNSTMMNPVLT